MAIIDDEIIDDHALDTLLELIGGDVASLHRLVATFAEETPDTLRDMRRAARRGDARALHRGAHNVRTGARYVGARRLEALAHRLESLAVELVEPLEGETLAHAVRSVETLSVAFEHARDALRRRVEDTCRT